MRILLFDPMNLLKNDERDDLIENINFMKNKIKSFFDRTKDILGIEDDIKLISNKNIIEDLSVGQALLSNLIIATTGYLINGKDIEGYGKTELIEEFKVGYGLYFGSLEVS